MLRKADFRRFFGIFKSMLCALLMCFVVTNAIGDDGDLSASLKGSAADYYYMGRQWGSYYDAALTHSEYFIAKVNLSAAGSTSFNIQATGVYYINWGDNDSASTLEVTTNSSPTPLSHTYNSAGTYEIKIARIGSVTADTYNLTSTAVPAISFANNTALVEIDGDLNAVFPAYCSIANNKKTCKYPRFTGAFKDCTNLTTVSSSLLPVVTSCAYSYIQQTVIIGSGSYSSVEYVYPTRMFESIFQGCTKLTTIYDDGLFNICKKTSNDMFKSAFAGCTALENINDKIFYTLQNESRATGGGGTNLMTLGNNTFNRTFENCIALKKIPENLFVGAETVNQGAFWMTFKGCSSLEELPQNLFRHIAATDLNGNGIFGHMFENCTKLGQNDNVAKNFIPPTLFENMNQDALTTRESFTITGDYDIMKDIFKGTNLLTTDDGCPEGYELYGLEAGNRWAPKFGEYISCLPAGTTVCRCGKICVGEQTEGTIIVGCVNPVIRDTTTGTRVDLYNPLQELDEDTIDEGSGEPSQSGSGTLIAPGTQSSEDPNVTTAPPITGNPLVRARINYYCQESDAITDIDDSTNDVVCDSTRPCKDSIVIDLNSLSNVTALVPEVSGSEICPVAKGKHGWVCIDKDKKVYDFGGLLDNRNYKEQVFVNYMAYISKLETSATEYTAFCYPSQVITTGDGVKRIADKIASDNTLDNTLLSKLIYTDRINTTGEFDVVKSRFEKYYLFVPRAFFNLTTDSLKPTQIVNNNFLISDVPEEEFAVDFNFDLKWRTHYECPADQTEITEAQKDWMKLITYSGYNYNSNHTEITSEDNVIDSIKVAFETKSDTLCNDSIAGWKMNTTFQGQPGKCISSNPTSCNFIGGIFEPNEYFEQNLSGFALKRVSGAEEEYAESATSYVEFLGGNTIYCQAGYYLRQGDSECNTPCLDGYYCPEGYFFFSQSKDQNLNSCAKHFGDAVIAGVVEAHSDNLRASPEECYLECPNVVYRPVGDVGKVYYSEGGINKCLYNITMNYVDTDGSTLVNGCQTDAVTNKTVGLNDEIDLCQNATKSGMNFEYWKNGSVLIDNYTINDKPTMLDLEPKAGATNTFDMVAVWEKKNYSIEYHYDLTVCNFDDLSGYTSYSTLVAGDTPFDLPDISPTSNIPEDMEFKGWCIWSENPTKNGNVCNNPQKKLEAPASGNKYAYARVAEKEYNITYEARGGTMSGTGITLIENPDKFMQKYTKPKAEMPLPKATRTGYRFVGWGGFGSEPANSLPAGTTGPIKLEAVWEYIVELHPNTSDETYNNANYNKWPYLDYNCMEYVPGQDDVLSGGLFPEGDGGIERLGYDFAGWCMGKKKCGPDDLANRLLVKNDALCAIVRQSSPTCPAAPANEGDSKCIVVTPDASSGTIKGYAQWNVITYSIKYLDEKTESTLDDPDYTDSHLKTTYTVEDRVTFKAPSEPKEDLYDTSLWWDFDGWYDNDTPTKKIAGFAPGSTTGDKILRAHWKPVMGKYRFMCSKENVIEIEGQVGSSSSDQADEDYKTAPTGERCNGIDIETWSCSNGVGAINPGEEFEFETDATVECKAGYKIIYKNIIKDEEQIDTELKPNSYTEENEVILPSDLYMNTKYSRAPGYSFNGWFYGYNPSRTRNVTSPFSNQATVLPTGLHGTRTFYGQWEPNTYSVSYKCSADGESISGSNATYDARYDLMSDSICTPDEGALFKNWACFTQDEYGMSGGLTCPSGTTKTNLISKHIAGEWSDGGVTVTTDGYGEYSVSGTASEDGAKIVIPMKNVVIPANHWIELNNNIDTEDVKLLLHFTDDAEVILNIHNDTYDTDLGSNYVGKTLEYVAITVAASTAVPTDTEDATIILKFAPSINICSTSDNENIIYGEFDENTHIAEWKFPGNTVCVAQWLPIKYNVQFSACADDVVGDMDSMTDVYYGDENENLTANAYVKPGYTFAGWCYGNDVTYSDETPNGCKENATLLADGALASTLTTDNGANVQLCAKWDLNTYRILYKNIKRANYYDEPLPAHSYTIEDLREGHTVVIGAPDHTKNGYSFNKWCVYDEEPDDGPSCEEADAEEQVEITGETELTDKWLYIRWKENVYEITLNKNYVGDAGYTAGTETVYEQYNKGWFKTYDAENDELSDNLSDTAIILPTRTNYKFGGYYTCPGTTGEPDCPQIIGDDGKLVTGASTTLFDDESESTERTLYAKWQGEYYLRFRCCGGTTCTSMENQKVTHNNTNETIKKMLFEKTGYDFVGWCYGDKFELTNANTNTKCCAVDATLLVDEQSPIPNLTETAGAEVQLGASWKPHDYNIIYYTEKDEDNWVEPTDYPPDWTTTYNIESEEITLPTPTKTGYDFDGWYDNPGLEGSAVESFVSSGLIDKKFYAKWKLKKIVCESGKYLPKGSEECVSCKENDYCPGSAADEYDDEYPDGFSYDETKDQGNESCSDKTNEDYPYSVAEDNDSIEKCFAKCEERPYHTLDTEDIKIYYPNSLDDLSNCQYGFVCETNVKLHVGDDENDEICLYEHDERPEADAYFGINVGNNKKYYMCLTEADSEDAPGEMHYGSSNKLHIVIDGQEYYAHDASVLY